VNESFDETQQREVSVNAYCKRFHFLTNWEKVKKPSKVVTTSQLDFIAFQEPIENEAEHTA
jgi:hypothetical protein